MNFIKDFVALMLNEPNIQMNLKYRGSSEIGLNFVVTVAGIGSIQCVKLDR